MGFGLPLPPSKRFVKQLPTNNCQGRLLLLFTVDSGSSWTLTLHSTQLKFWHQKGRLRGAGLSGAKTRAIKDLALHTVQGTVPLQSELEGLPDEEIIERLTIVNGVGPWSVKMYLMFRLGRPDVLPQTDLGIRKGVQRSYGLSVLPAPKEVITRAEPWRPFRTLASWYLWRSLEMENPLNLPSPA